MRKEHRWELQRAGDTNRPQETRFEWRCAHCLSDTFTIASGSGGAHKADDHLPGRRALQATWVPEDCEEALVQAVCEL